jgi:spore coat polysaccharide biosynthesis protein SpsF
MGSSRLPGKVLAEVAGAPVLLHLLERVRAARTPFLLVLATTTAPADEPIADLGHRAGVEVFRGHPTDLLDRHYQVGARYAADAVVKIPSDCPLIDPAAIDRVLRFFGENAGRFDFVSNLHPPTWPDGNDVEVMTMAALSTAWREARRTFEREHTTPFLWDNPEHFRIGNVSWEGGLDLHASHRFVLDYPEDLAFLRAVFAALHRPGGPVFTLAEILDLLSERPDILALNRTHAGDGWYRQHLHELRTIASEDQPVPVRLAAPVSAESEAPS